MSWMLIEVIFLIPNFLNQRFTELNLFLTRCFRCKVGNGLYLESGSVIRAVGNPASDVAIAVDPNFEIADLPVKLELRYVIESKRAANGLECPKTDYRLRDAKNQQVLFYILAFCKGLMPSFSTSLWQKFEFIIY